MKINRLFVMTTLVFMLAFSIISISALQPFEASTLTEVATSRATQDGSQTDEALAGNVTEITLTADTITQTWQGYFGNVTGSIELADSSNNVLYNWSLADPEGEVYATELASPNWAGITCFDILENDTLEAYFNIASDDVDGVDETFFQVNEHDLFYTNNVQFSAGDCPTAFIFDDSGTGVDNSFEEVLMTDGSSNETIIYASIIEESSVLGFDNRDHDFEMLVLEDGHGTDTTTTTYYFYVELE